MERYGMEREWKGKRMEREKGWKGTPISYVHPISHILAVE
jgi:hypothetical protein